jgi:hypothetical protein
MTEIQVDVEYGKVYAVDLAAIANGALIVGGPADLMGWSVRDFGLENNQEAFGSVVSPGAGTVIAQLPAIQQADYEIRWQVQLIGAAAAADQDNFGLYAGATLLVTSLNPGAAGVYPQTQTAFYDQFGQALSIKAIAAGTVGVTYAAQFSIVPIGFAGPVLQLQDGNQELAEIYCPIFGADTRWFGPSGIRVNGTMKKVVNVGVLAGAIYVRYSKD